MRPESSDAEVLRASLSDPEAFAMIVDRYQVDILRFTSRMANRRESSDLTSEVFYRAFKKRKTYDMSIPDARPWLFSIAANVASDHLRSLNVRYRHRGAAWKTVGREFDPTDDVVDTVVAQTARSSLSSALGTLSRGDRVVLVMVAWGQLTQPEVAQALGIPVGTVKSRLSRAKRQMRESVPDLHRLLEEL